MGTRFELALVTGGDTSADGCLKAIGETAIHEIDEWHRRLTRFESDSWLSFVNRTAAQEAVRLDDEVLPLFADAEDVWRISGGAFDITRGHGDALIVDRASRSLRFGHDRVSLDLGAIGKGHALDRAAAHLRHHGVTRALLQGGTSSGIAMGQPPGASAWRIGVSSNATDGRVDTVFDLEDEAFSVSDEASQPDAPFGRHIVDPRERHPTPTTRLPRRVLVMGPSARLADAWSTALAVLGHVPPAFPSAYRAQFLRE